MNTHKTEITTESISTLELDCLRLESEIKISNVDFLSRTFYGNRPKPDDEVPREILRASELISHRESIEIKLAGMLSAGSHILPENQPRGRAKKSSYQSPTNNNRVNRQSFFIIKLIDLRGYVSSLIAKSHQNFLAIFHKR